MWQEDLSEPVSTSISQIFRLMSADVPLEMASHTVYPKALSSFSAPIS